MSYLWSKETLSFQKRVLKKLNLPESAKLQESSVYAFPYITMTCKECGLTGSSN